MRKLSISSTIWFTLIITTIITNVISNLLSLPLLVWSSYSLLIGVAFLSLKLWNKTLQEPILDVNLTYLEMSISIILAILVSILGGTLLQLDNMQNSSYIIVMCFVMTTCQFTLIKSAQPDPASPTHGFNRVISLSRPIYFCILAIVLLICETYLKSPTFEVDISQRSKLIFYSFDVLDKSVLTSIGKASFLLIILLPILFILGLLPQITTFIIHVLEQIDMHLFGSTSSTLGLKSSIYSFTRSCLVIALLYVIALQSLSHQILSSLFFGLLVSMAYVLSRQSSDPTIMFRLIERSMNSFNPAKYHPGADKIELQEFRSSPTQDEIECWRKSISTKIQNCIDDVCVNRLKNDLIIFISATIIVFALHVSSVFNSHYHEIGTCFGILVIIWGIIFHFVLPQLRRDVPFMCVAKPILRPKEYNLFEVKSHAKVMWYERLHYFAIGFEKFFIQPIFWLNVITHDSSTIREHYGLHMGTLLLIIMGMKLIRSTFNEASYNYVTIIFTYIFFNYDIAPQNHRIFTINYFVFSILHLKIRELLLKLQFVYIYIAPWQISWGSAFHAFAHPFSVPHSALLYFQAILSSILSAPLQPILGSAMFIMSYVRPVKFWERNYNTNVIDINSTRLVTQLERNQIDSNRFDGVFYEQLTKSLQKKLCRDLAYGRWGPVSQGDCFIMASDNLNCLVHIIEYGNGLCTFQLRGLEFKGTYCQQQEVEAITEGVPKNDGFCCCSPGHLPHFLSANAAFDQMWLAWHVTHTRYVLEGYTVSDNPAEPMLQPFELRRALLTYYVKAIIYFAVTSQHLAKWLKTSEFHEALEHTKGEMYADLDPTFTSSLDLDFDNRLCGVTREKFCSVHFDWIRYCFDRVVNDKNDAQRANSLSDLECEPNSFLVTLCYGLSLVARRSLSAASDGQQSHTVESLLFGLHALLKGDFRVTSGYDEWIFQEMRLFKLVVIPAVRMSLKLHLDHFAAPDDYTDNMVLYEAIAGYQKNLVIAHETDLAWRTAVLSGSPSLLTLRMYLDMGINEYKFIMLNRRYLSFRIIKINRECVRGLWASQQQELIFFRNTDPERGSIQNAKQALRNMINSSCDQPVGYPIYVSALTTSYLESGRLSTFIS